MSSIYQINKGVGKPIMFKGLKGQYIAYLAIGLLLLLLIFSIGYVAGLSVYVLVPTIIIMGTVIFFIVFRLSHRFGEHGLMKYFAKRSLPHYLKFRSRRLFINLKHKHYDRSN